MLLPLDTACVETCQRAMPTLNPRDPSQQDRATFKDFVEDSLAGPLRTLSPIGVGGVELFADIYAGEDLK